MHARATVQSILLACTFAMYVGVASAAEPATQPARLSLENAGLRLGSPIGFSAGGKGILTLHGEVIHLWDSETGRPIRTFSADRQITEGVCSADGTTVAARSGNRMVVWDIASGKQIAALAMDNGFVFSPALSNDGKSIAWIVVNSRAIVVHDVASGKELATFSVKEEEGQPGRLLFSPDGSMLADGASGLIRKGDNFQPFYVVRVWDLAAKRRLFQSKLDESGPGPLAFTPDGKRLIAGSTLLRLWEIATGKELANLQLGGASCTHSTFIPGQNTLICTIYAPTLECSSMRVAVNDAELKAAETRPLPRGNTLLSHDGRYAAHGNAAVNIVETETGKMVGIDVGPTSPTKMAAFTADGSRIISATTDGMAFIWDAHTGKKLQTIDLQISNLVDAAISPDGATLVATDDIYVYGFETATGKSLYTARPVQGRRVSLTAFSPDGKRVAVAGRLFDMQMNWGLYVWDSQTGGLPKVERGLPTWHVTGFRWTPDGKQIAAGCMDGTVRLFDGATGTEAVVLRLPGDAAPIRQPPNVRQSTEQSIHSIDISPDGRLIAASMYNGDLAIWNTTGGGLAQRLPKVETSTYRLRFDPNGRALATLGIDGTITFRELGTGAKVGQLHCGPAVAGWNFSPDGQRIVIVGDPAENAIWRSPLAVAKEGTAVDSGFDAATLDKLWVDLASPDSGHAFHAATLLSNGGESAIKYLAARLVFAPPPPEVRTRALALINDLSADDFRTRGRAEKFLREMRGAARPVMFEAMKNPASNDAHDAMERILEDPIPVDHLTPEDARFVRGITAIEQIGGPEAIKLLESIWDTATNDLAASEARASLKRLKMKK